MKTIYYIGLDIHKKIVAYCIKDVLGEIVDQGTVSADRVSLANWVKGLPGPWVGAMEATLFTGWIYDFLLPHAVSLKVAHPQMLKAIVAAKKKNDNADAAMIADLLRVNLLPEAYMMPTEMRELRRMLRYRHLIVRTSVILKNKMSGLLMEVGAQYNKKRLHGKRYFNQLLETVEDVPESVKEMLRMSRSGYELFYTIQKKLTKALREMPQIHDRVELLMTIPGVGELTALTWVLEIGDLSRFTNTGKLISYCGLCSAQKESAGKERRGPLSKQRNKHLQTVLIEAANISPRWNPGLAEVYAKVMERGNCNMATIAVARKLVKYLLAVDRRGTPFKTVNQAEKAA